MHGSAFRVQVKAALGRGAGVAVGCVKDKLHAGALGDALLVEGVNDVVEGYADSKHCGSPWAMHG